MKGDDEQFLPHRESRCSDASAEPDGVSSKRTAERGEFPYNIGKSGAIGTSPAAPAKPEPDAPEREKKDGE